MSGMSTSDRNRKTVFVASLLAGIGAADVASANIVATAWMPTQARPGYLAGEPEQPVGLSVPEMVGHMRDAGLPISAIAEMLRVERKTIYAWLDGAVVRKENAERISALFDVLTASEGENFKPIYRVWNQPIGGAGSLRALLTAENLDIHAIQEAVHALEGALAHYARIEGNVGRGKRDGNPVTDATPVADLT